MWDLRFQGFNEAIMAMGSAIDGVQVWQLLQNRNRAAAVLESPARKKQFLQTC
jgi:predicted AlkP superfamily phosphohydrolase/phosphomutase